jgi:hypothetical protein
MVFIQPNGFSTRLRSRCDTVWPACRVVRPSIAERRLPLTFCATCGVKLSWRVLATKSLVS